MAWAAEFLTECDDSEKRFAARRLLQLSVKANRPEDSPFDAAPQNPASVLVHNISQTGLLIETGEKLKTGEKFDVTLPEIGTTEVGVIWRSGQFYGCEFMTPVSSAVVSATLLRSPTKPLHALSPAESSSAAAWDDLAENGEFPELQEGRPLSFGSKMLIIIGADLVLWGMIALLVWAVFW